MLFWKRRPFTLRPSRAHELRGSGDQLPFFGRARFSAMPPPVSTISPRAHQQEDNLTLFVAILYVVDLFGVFPLVTLPSLLVQLGFYSGIPLVLSIIGLQIYTSFLLSKCWSMAETLDPTIVQKSRYPYAAIADLAYGPLMSCFVTLLLDLSIFATSVPCLVMAAQNLELVGERISDGRFVFSFCFWLIVIGLFVCPLMWMGSPKHMRGLAILSMCVLIVIVILLWYCLFAAPPLGRPFDGVRLELPPLLKVLGGYSVLAFQFDIHPMLLTLQIDMQQKSQVSWAAFSGIAITTTIAVFGSVVAAYKFGASIAENLLETLPKSVPLFLLLILVALQLCFSAIVGSSAMFLQIENYFKISESFSLKRVAIRSTLVTLQVLIAEFVPSFDVLMDVVGGTITGPLVFILPPLLYRRISHMQRLQRRRMAAEATYGSFSLPLDLNFDADTLDMDELLPNASIGAGATKQAPRVKRWRGLRRHLRRLPCCELSPSMGVLVFGIAATFLASYLNIFQISQLFQKNSCIANFTRLF